MKQNFPNLPDWVHGKFITIQTDVFLSSFMSSMPEILDFLLTIFLHIFFSKTLSVSYVICWETRGNLDLRGKKEKCVTSSFVWVYI